jgi:hypothetical protein
MALSIEFGIAMTYALGVGFYVACCLMVALSRRASPVVVAPSIQPMSIELDADRSTAKPLVLTVAAAKPSRADAAVE